MAPKTEKQRMYEEAVKRFEESQKALEALQATPSAPAATPDMPAAAPSPVNPAQTEAHAGAAKPAGDASASNFSGLPKPWAANEGEGLEPDFELTASLSVHDVIGFVETNKLAADSVVSELVSTFQVTAVPTGHEMVDKILPCTEETREVEKYILVKEPQILFIRDVITQAEVIALVHYAKDLWNIYEGVGQRRSIGGSGYIRIAPFEQDCPELVKRLMTRMTQLCKVDPSFVPVMELRELKEGCSLPCGFEPTSATCYIFLKNPSAGGKVVFPCANLTMSPELGSAIQWTNSVDGNAFDVRVLNQVTVCEDKDVSQILCVIHWLNPEAPAPPGAEEETS